MPNSLVILDCWTLAFRSIGSREMVSPTLATPRSIRPIASRPRYGEWSIVETACWNGPSLSLGGGGTAFTIMSNNGARFVSGVSRSSVEVPSRAEA